MLTELKLFGVNTSAPLTPWSTSESVLGDQIQIKNIEGLGPVKANINSTPYGSRDGEAYGGSSIGKRNIVLTLAYNPDWTNYTVHDLRQIVYSYFMTKQWIRLQFSRDSLPTVEIEGYVESVEPNIWSKDPEVQVSIVCLEPNFVAVEPTVVTGQMSYEIVSVIPPTEIINLGNQEAPFTLRIDKDPAKPVIDSVVTVYNTSPFPEYFRFASYADNGKFIKLSTIPGQKYLRVYTASTGLYTNEMNNIQAGSKWLTLKPGANQFQLVSGVGNHPWELTYFAQFGGL